MRLDRVNPNLVLIGALAVVGIYLLVKAKDAAGSALNAVNPTNRENVFYSGTNAFGAALSGNPDFSLGGAIYEATHDAQGGNTLNPANPNNVVYSAWNAPGKWLSGNQDWTLGGWIYDVTHPNS